MFASLFLSLSLCLCLSVSKFLSLCTSQLLFLSFLPLPFLLLLPSFLQGVDLAGARHLEAHRAHKVNRPRGRVQWCRVYGLVYYAGLKCEN